MRRIKPVFLRCQDQDSDTSRSVEIKRDTGKTKKTYSLGYAGLIERENGRQTIRKTDGKCINWTEKGKESRKTAENRKRSGRFSAANLVLIHPDKVYHL